MNNLSRAVQRSLAAVACALFLLPTATVLAAPGPISIDARALVAGRFDTNGWAALAVSLTNDAAPVSGYVTATGVDGAVRRVVELPAGARKQLALYVRPQPFARQIDVSFWSNAGEKLASAAAPVKVLESTTGDVAVVGDGGGTLRGQLAGRGAGLPDPIDLTPADIPERPEPLAGIEAMIWAGDSTSLSEGQRRSIERWVAEGGQLVVLGGGDWQSRTAAFAPLLPLTDLTGTDGVSVTGLAEWLGADAPPAAGSVTAALGPLRDGAVGLDESEQPLLSVIASGAGRVIYLAVDPGAAPLRGWDAASPLWSRLLPQDVLSGMFGGGPTPDDLVAGQMNQAISYIPSLQVPPAELLLVVIVGYILLIGPINYFVLRRMDRRELAWATAPALVVVFSFGSYGIGTAIKGSDIIVNRISVARTTVDGTAASMSTYAGIFSPGRETYDLTVEADALMSSLNSSAFFNGGGQPQPVDYVTEQGDPAHLRGLSVGVSSLQAIRADAIVPYQPALAVDWSYSGGEIVGTVTNTSNEPINDVAVIQSGSGDMVGTLDPGQSEEFTLTPARNFDGRAPSDLVYGFNNFDDPQLSERDLQVLARRSVIDALAGYGGDFPPELLAAVDQQPMVVGWRQSGSSLPVTVDGHQTRTYDQTIEVIGGSPKLGRGEVRLAPGQLRTAVLSTTGDAQRQEFGAVVLGSGEVHFGISMPLEASGLVPSKVTIQVGTDPMSVLANQGDFGGQTPPGFRLAVHNRQTDEWVDLGDLGQHSSFEVPDPASVFGDRGAMEVRVSAAGVNGNEFGEVPIFIGASVEGSL